MAVQPAAPPVQAAIAALREVLDGSRSGVDEALPRDRRTPFTLERVPTINELRSTLSVHAAAGRTSQAVVGTESAFKLHKFEGGKSLTVADMRKELEAPPDLPDADVVASYKKQLLYESRMPAYMAALRQLKAEDPAAHQQVTDTMARLHALQPAKLRALASEGVFESGTNVVRARAAYRVALRRALCAAVGRPEAKANTDARDTFARRGDSHHAMLVPGSEECVGDATVVPRSGDLLRSCVALDSDSASPSVPPARHSPVSAHPCAASESDNQTSREREKCQARAAERERQPQGNEHSTKSRGNVRADKAGHAVGIDDRSAGYHGGQGLPRARKSAQGASPAEIYAATDNGTVRFASDSAKRGSTTASVMQQGTKVTASGGKNGRVRRSSGGASALSSSARLSEPMLRELRQLQQLHVQKYRSIIVAKRDALLRELGVDARDPEALDAALRTLQDHSRAQLAAAATARAAGGPASETEGVKGYRPPTDAAAMLTILVMDKADGESRSHALARNAEVWLGAAAARMHALALPKKKKTVRSWERAQEVLETASEGDGALSRPMTSNAAALRAATPTLPLQSFGTGEPAACLTSDPSQPLRASSRLVREAASGATDQSHVSSNRSTPRAGASRTTPAALLTLAQSMSPRLAAALAPASGEGADGEPSRAASRLSPATSAMTGPSGSVRKPPFRGSGGSAAAPQLLASWGTASGPFAGVSLDSAAASSLPCGDEAAAAAAREADRVAKEHAAARIKEVLGPVQPPSAREVAALCVPPLPPPPPAVAAASFGELTQWRMERVWAALRMSGVEKLDMVLKYCTWGALDLMTSALEVWEAAVAAVAMREQTLSELLKVRDESERASPNVAALKTVTSLCKELLCVTARVETVGEELSKRFGDVLTFEGAPYPGPLALKLANLSHFCENVQHRISQVAAGTAELPA